jgi:hypothetical protein
VNLFPTRALSNTDIEKYYKNDRRFAGVFSRNDLPKTIYNKNYIINMDDRSGFGTHWVAVINTGSRCIYFDSFGVYPPEEVLLFMRSSGKENIMNEYRVQDVGSLMCGYFCIYFIDSINNGKDFCDVLLEFDPQDYSMNDILVKKKLGI